MHRCKPIRCVSEDTSHLVGDIIIIIMIILLLLVDTDVSPDDEERMRRCGLLCLDVFVRSVRVM